MFNKNSILACAQSLVGWREDNNELYDDLYNSATATSGNQMIFDADDKTITWSGDSFEDEDFEVGDSIDVNLTDDNDGTYTIAAISAGVITTVESLVDETSSTANIQALSHLQESESGIYFNDLPGVTFEMLNANISDDITAKQYLANVYESEALNLVNQFVNKSKQNYQSKEILSKQDIVSGVASMNNKVTQNQRFVGYWLRPHRSNYMKSSIISLGFQATGTQDSLRIFLYETSQMEAIKTFEFPITKAYSLTWQTVSEWILAYESLNGGTGQDYLLGYYENQLDHAEDWQLQSQALYLNFDCNCPGSPKTIYGKYLGIQSIEINNQYLNWNSDTETFDIPLVDNVTDFITSQTYGLLAKINVACDITDVLCENISIFARPLQHAVACRILYDAYASNRINSISDSKREQTKAFAMKYDGVLNGYSNGEGVKIKGLVDTLTVDFSALDKYCLPCSPGIMIGHLRR